MQRAQLSDQQIDLTSLSVITLSQFHTMLHAAEFLTGLNMLDDTMSDEHFFNTLVVYSVLSEQLESVHLRQKAIKDSLDRMNTQKHLEVGKLKIDDVNRKKVNDIASGRFSQLGLFTPVGHDYRSSRAFLTTAQRHISMSNESDSSSSAYEFISLDDSGEMVDYTPNSSFGTMSQDQFSSDARRSLSSANSSDGSLPVTPNASREDLTEFEDESTPCLPRSQSVGVRMFSSSSESVSLDTDSDEECLQHARGYRRI